MTTILIAIALIGTAALVAMTFIMKKVLSAPFFWIAALFSVIILFPLTGGMSLPVAISLIIVRVVIIKGFFHSLDKADEKKVQLVVTR